VSKKILELKTTEETSHWKKMTDNDFSEICMALISYLNLGIACGSFKMILSSFKYFDNLHKSISKKLSHKVALFLKFDINEAV